MSKQEIDKAWTEHTAPNNIKYYYNAITKESTYSKPEALVLASGGPSPTDTWVEYTDVTSGKKYYSNGVTTTWESPETFISHPEKVTLHPPEEEEPPQKKKKVSQKSIQFSSKAEAIAAFKGLLLAKDIQPTTKWNDVVKLCSPDPRWEACEVLTQGERKQALAEYQTKRANELRDSERQERVRAKEAFSGLLSEMLSNIESFNPATSRFADLRSLLSKDDRFHAVHDEATRESLFLEFCEEVRKRDERKKRNKRREAKESFLGFLREQEESGVLTFASTW
jgi:pre-mRNA-processing factor 40